MQAPAMACRNSWPHERAGPDAGLKRGGSDLPRLADNLGT
jgi:hypothetical protein